jgi:EmrB/QacA subfamily drug resistance transporter
MDSLVLPVPHVDRRPNAAEHARFRAVFFDVAPAMFIGTLDQAIVAAALPTIGKDLGAPSHVSWLVTVYLLCATVAAPVYGRVGDALGRKQALLGALAIFLAGSLACAVAPTLLLLIAARALQGLGGGGLMILAQALIGETVSPKERGRFQGWFAAVFALASTLGPVAGGFLTEHLGWRSIFWVNIPLGGIAAASALRLRAARGAGGFSPDFLGTFLFVAATVALLMALSLGNSAGWASPRVSLLFLSTVVCGAMLWPVEHRTLHPLLPTSVVRHPVVWRCAICVLLFAATLFAVIVELPVLLQTGLGLRPSTSGLVLVPLTLAQVLVSTATGNRISRNGRPRLPMVAGLAILATGMLLLALTVNCGLWFVCGAVAVVGTGLGTTMPAAQTAVQWAAGPTQLGSATAILSFARSVGGVCGAALASALFLAVLHGVSGAAGAVQSTSFGGATAIPTLGGPEDVRDAFRWVFAAMAVFGALAAIVARTMPDIDLGAPSRPPRP